MLLRLLLLMVPLLVLVLFLFLFIIVAATGCCCFSFYLHLDYEFGCFFGKYDPGLPLCLNIVHIVSQGSGGFLLLVFDELVFVHELLFWIKYLCSCYCSGFELLLLESGQLLLLLLLRLLLE